jgi:hypothetical protein
VKNLVEELLSNGVVHAPLRRKLRDAGKPTHNP